MTHTTSEITTQRKTKIVATIGPACSSVETLADMINAGMNVARLNLSHGTLAEHKKQIGRLRQASRQAGSNIAIMIDTRGIEIRTGLLAGGTAELLPGAAFTLFTTEQEGN